MDDDTLARYQICQGFGLTFDECGPLRIDVDYPAARAFAVTVVL